MKKSFVLALLSATTMTAAAQTQVMEMEYAYTRFIPGAYMKNGVAALYFSGDEYGYDNNESDRNKAEIYDFELQLIKSFDIDMLQPYSKVEQRVASSEPKAKVREIFRSVTTLSNIPSTSDMEERANSFLNYLNNNVAMYDPYADPLTNYSVRNDTILVFYPNSETLGNEGNPIWHYRGGYLAPNNDYGNFDHYATTVTEYQGEWQSTTFDNTPERNLCIARFYDVKNINSWSCGLFLPFSQTFFNDDDKFEYVRYIAEISEGGSTGEIGVGNNPYETLFGITDKDRDGDGQEDYRSTYYGIHIKGVQVVSENGDVIYNFPIPNNVEGNVEMNFYKNDNQILAEAVYRWTDADGNYMTTTRFYRIDKSSGVVNVVRESTKMAASPNPASIGTPINITLPPAKSDNRNIIVTSMSGACAYRQIVAPGATSVSIPTNALQSGMYIFTLSDNGVATESCKIIIR